MSDCLTKDNLLKESYKEYNPKKDFTSLEAWKKCDDVKVFFYKNIISLLPDEERFNLGTQIRKSAVSITANIAEGYGRFHYQEGVQFYRISRGSLYELKDHLMSCYNLNFIPDELYDEGIKLIEEAKIVLNGFINYVKKRKRGE